MRPRWPSRRGICPGWIRVVGALVLAGGGLMQSGCDGNRERDNILRVGIEARPGTFDPRFSTDAASSRIGELIFARLVKFDEHGEIVPDVAERWEISPDGRRYTFHLRDDVRFHDGSKLDADDVVATFENLLDPATGSPKRSTFEALDGVEANGATEVSFQLTEPSAPLLSNLVHGLLPQEALGPEPAGAAVTIGAGPFRLVENQEGALVRLAAFEQYFGGRPRLDGIEIHYIAEDTLRILELQKGSIDFIQNDLTPELLPTLKSDENIRVMTAPGVNYSYLGMNLRDPILLDLQVRQAIGHALDRPSIIEHILGETVTQAETILSPGSWAHHPDLKPMAYDPERSRALLDSAGYPDPDGDGPQARFSLVYKTSTNELRKRIAEVFQRNLQEVGIDVRLETYEFSTLYSDIKKGNFQLFSLTWVGLADPDILHYIFHSTSTPPGGNRVNYSSAEVDALLERGRVTSEREERKRIYREIQEHLARDLPYISLWYTNNVACMRSDVRGFRLYPAGNYYGLAEVHFDDLAEAP